MEEDKKIVIERVFDAPRQKVWEAWTSPEIVKKWWGPKDFTAPVIQIDFTVGGKYLYCMHGPKDTQFDVDMYNAGEFKEIVPMEKIVVRDYFSDKNGNKIDPTTMGLPAGMPVEMDLTVMFEDTKDGKTKLSLVYPTTSQEMYDALMKSGMEEGWGTSLDKLAAVLQ